LGKEPTNPYPGQDTIKPLEPTCGKKINTKAQVPCQLAVSMKRSYGPQKEDYLLAKEA